VATKLRQIIANTALGRKFKNGRTRLDFERRLRTVHPPVIIYQMGKVGSSSVADSLARQYPGVAIHTHAFSQKDSNPYIRKLHQWAIRDRKPLRVISLTREPISRNVSAFFHNFERDTGVPFAEHNFSLQDLKALFLSNYRHQIPLQWFDKNILSNFNIDVFKSPFPPTGSCIYTQGNVELLVIKVELTDAAKEAALRDFLRLSHFKLENTNIAARKDYNATYAAFVQQVKFPEDYISMMLSSKYARCFYSPEDLAAARLRWAENP